MIGACHTCRCICLRPGEMDGTCGLRVMLHAAIRIGAETRGATRVGPKLTTRTRLGADLVLIAAMSLELEYSQQLFRATVSHLL